jgi:hypothetical protein
MAGRKKHDVKETLRQEPDAQFRRVSADHERYAEEHQVTTESHRWGEPGTSEEERGYPREAGEELPRRERTPAEEAEEEEIP